MNLNEQTTKTRRHTKTRTFCRAKYQELSENRQITGRQTKQGTHESRRTTHRARGRSQGQNEEMQITTDLNNVIPQACRDNRLVKQMHVIEQEQLLVKQQKPTQTRTSICCTQHQAQSSEHMRKHENTKTESHRLEWRTTGEHEFIIKGTEKECSNSYGPQRRLRTQECDTTLFAQTKKEFVLKYKQAQSLSNDYGPTQDTSTSLPKHIFQHLSRVE